MADTEEPVVEVVDAPAPAAEADDVVVESSSKKKKVRYPPLP